VTTRHLLLLVALAGCSGAARDPERLGDAAWHEARWTDAVNAYLAAGDSPRVIAKLADAAFQAGLFQQAAQSWTRVGVDAPDRSGEAAAELARTAIAAERAGDQDALATAILGLRKVAPGWPLGRLALRLVSTAGLPAADAVEILPAALAAAPARSAADPLLAAMGRADRERGACEEAVPVLEGVLRRSGNAALRDSAGADLGSCELRLGLDALTADRPGEAERWLDRASRRDPDGVIGRRALVGFGDARWRQGDVMSATFAWQSVAAASAAPDSITALALARLQDPSTAGTTPDSVAGPGNH
jgi:tetratricopeptide (TPR) repeat protein